MTENFLIEIFNLFLQNRFGLVFGHTDLIKSIHTQNKYPFSISNPIITQETITCIRMIIKSAHVP